MAFCLRKLQCILADLWEKAWSSQLALALHPLLRNGTTHMPHKCQLSWVHPSAHVSACSPSRLASSASRGRLLDIRSFGTEREGGDPGAAGTAGAEAAGAAAAAAAAGARAVGAAAGTDAGGVVAAGAGTEGVATAAGAGAGATGCGNACSARAGGADGARGGDAGVGADECVGVGSGGSGAEEGSGDAASLQASSLTARLLSGERLVDLCISTSLEHFMLLGKTRKQARETATDSNCDRKHTNRDFAQLSRHFLSTASNPRLLVLTCHLPPSRVSLPRSSSREVRIRVPTFSSSLF